MEKPIINILKMFPNKFDSNIVLTPPKIAQEMIDMLPDTVWNSKTTFFAPACKSGIFLYLIYEKLMSTPYNEPELQDPKAKRNHILHNQLFGFSDNQFCVMFSTRTVYGYLDPDSNIKFIEKYTDIMKNADSRYFIEAMKKEFGTMQFDVVIGNLPYNNDIYIDFLLKLKSSYNSYMCMITPAKWQANETITADFRKYPCIEDSIADHSAYLLGAMNGKKLRYDGLKGRTDYKKAVQIIKDGGYATSLTYVEKLCGIIEKWKLTDFDVKDSGGSEEVIRWFRVRKNWADAKSQKEAYKILENAKKCADQNPGYKVFDVDGKVVYEPAGAKPDKPVVPKVKVPFLVKVSIKDLNIRKGPGTNYDKVKFIPVGVYTIVEVKAGAGASAWGRLKSGVGWISLDFCQRI